jgi:DNA-binding MarR family transcriptional regulator
MEAQGMAGHLIRRLHQISTQVFTKQMKQAGLDLTQVQFAALDAIHANPGIDQARVAALIAYDRATIGGVIDRLEQKSLVARRISPRDRRAREVSLSREGETVFQAMLPIVQALQADILSDLTLAERDTFLKLARKASGAVPD